MRQVGCGLEVLNLGAHDLRRLGLATQGTHDQQHHAMAAFNQRQAQEVRYRHALEELTEQAMVAQQHQQLREHKHPHAAARSEQLERLVKEVGRQVGILLKGEV